MSNDILLLLHPTLGIFSILITLWLFVDILNNNQKNQLRIKMMSVLQALFMWGTYLVAGYWYVNYFSVDKTLILAGPWPFAHSIFMETKEHAFFILLLLSTYLPIVVLTNSIFLNKNARILSLWVAAFIILLSLGMEGAGAVINMGVKVALLAKVTS